MPVWNRYSIGIRLKLSFAAVSALLIVGASAGTYGLQTVMADLGRRAWLGVPATDR